MLEAIYLLVVTLLFGKIGAFFGGEANMAHELNTAPDGYIWLMRLFRLLSLLAFVWSAYRAAPHLL